MELFITALIWIESSNNDLAYNNESGATGPLQIKQILIDDINRIYKTDYGLYQCFDREISIEIFRLTMEHYATRELLGVEPTIRDWVGIWKSGLVGYKYSPLRSTKHWAKVMARMYALSNGDMVEIK